MKKLRRRTFEMRVREFIDVAQFVTDHPLLLWSPAIEQRAKALVKAVREAQQRSRAWSGEQRRETQ
jgi:hypothetical protein